MHSQRSAEFAAYGGAVVRVGSGAGGLVGAGCCGCDGITGAAGILVGAAAVVGVSSGSAVGVGVNGRRVRTRVG
jgi:hypothetical protein